jgi:COP9 signalosome complex subunit 6
MSNGLVLADPKQGETSPLVLLHPLVTLNITDYVARHTLRNMTGPIVGAILGQQNGRQITLEVGFDCKVSPSDAPGGYKLDEAWLEERVNACKLRDFSGGVALAARMMLT